MALPTAPISPPALRRPRRMSISEFLKLLASMPTVLLCMAAFMCENLAAMVLFTWMPMFLYQKCHLTLAMTGLTATLYIRTTSMLGSPIGGRMADTLRKRMPGGRILVQAIGIFFEAPFAAWCALTGSLHGLIVSLQIWWIFKGFYKANLFASVFDVIGPEARGTATGFMNMMGWLAGGGSSPVVVSLFADRIRLGRAMAATASSYAVASLLLLTAALKFAKADTARMQAALTNGALAGV